MVDPRAHHYWDGRRTLGREVARTLGNRDGVAAWDIFLVYGPEASWGDQPDAVGSSVISENARLQQALEPYL